MKLTSLAALAGICFGLATIVPLFVAPGVIALVLCADLIVNKQDWE